MNFMCIILKESFKSFYLVLNHQVISVTTLSYQLSCIMFCIVSPCIVLKGKANVHFIFPTAASSLSLLTMQRVCYN